MNSNTPAQKNQLEISPIPRSDDFLKNKGSLASIPVNSIIADPIFQMRANGIDDVIVRRYAEVMQSHDPDGWQIFPRITLLAINDIEDDWYDQSKFYVIGGFHRLAAMQERGYKDVEAVVILGSTADGVVFAAGENDDKSVRRTLKDIRRAVISCLKHPEIKAWTNPKIAEFCAVDVQTVRNWEIWLYKNDPDYSRPEKLKFRDKYGGIGLRNHSIPNFAVEVNVVEIEEKRKADEAMIQLRSQVSAGYSRVLAYTADPDSAVHEQRDADLLSRFPDLSLYKLLDTLSHDELTTLEVAVKGADEFIRAEKSNVRDEIREIFYEIDLTSIDYNMENGHDIGKKRREAIYDRFPGYKTYDDENIWDWEMSGLVHLRTQLIEARDYIAEHGDTEFMPQEYFDVKQAMDTAEKDTEAREKLIKEFCAIQNSVHEKIIDYAEQVTGVEKDALSYQAEDQAWETFKAKYNQSCAKAEADDLKILKKMEERFDWDIKRKAEAYSLEKLNNYMRRWGAVLKLVEEGHALLKDKEAASPHVKLFWEEYPTALQISMSSIEIHCTGFGKTILADHTIKSQIPLSQDELKAICQAGIDAAAAEYKRIHAKRKKVTKQPDEDVESVDFETYIKCRDKAFKAWKAYSPKWGIDGNWSEFCLHIEPEVGREGCLSLINPEDATDEELKERVEAWNNVCTAIDEEHASVLSFPPIIRERDRVDAEAAAEEGSDLQGLREEIDDLLDSITHDIAIEVPGLAGIYGVSREVVEEEIVQAKANRGIEAETESDPDSAENSDDDQKRAWTMEEAEDLYDSIEGEIGDLGEEEQVAARQFLKQNYDAYATYEWREKLTIEALETLAETLDQIYRGIGVKRSVVDWFRAEIDKEVS